MTTEQQLRRMRDMSNPEMQRRRRMYNTARGARKELIGRWNVAWQRAGRPMGFLDFPQWQLTQELQIESLTAY